MVELALSYDKGPLSIKEVARRQDISVKYLEQLVTSLKIGGLVRSIRGAYGGYTLSRAPEDIKLSEIIRILEGPTSPVECLDDSDRCDKIKSCAARDLWARMKEAVDNVLDSTTLKDLARLQEEKNKQGG
jgi:Rrf2 family protein